jgi:transglutaminase-like putative cysteine protease
MLNVHPSRAPDLVTPDRLRITPARSITPYVDGFGNKCVRVLAPPGQIRIACDTIVADSGRPDRVDLSAEQHAVADLPHDALVYLLASRYCETDLMMNKAWELFGATPPGWRRVQAICDFVHAHIKFNYQDADATRGAARGPITFVLMLPNRSTSAPPMNPRCTSPRWSTCITSSSPVAQAASATFGASLIV